MPESWYKTCAPRDRHALREELARLRAQSAALDARVRAVEFAITLARDGWRLERGPEITPVLSQDLFHVQTQKS